MLAIVTAGVLAATGCSALGTAQGGQLEGLTWRLTSYLAGDGSTVEVPDAISATATFAAGTVSGTNGCNSYNGPYQASGSSLSVGPLISTLIGCGPAQSAVETAFMTLLQAAGSYTASDSLLTIYDQSGAQTMVFESMPALTLVGTPWEVTGYNNGREAVRSPVVDSFITLQFQAESVVTGNATCNTYNGTFTSDDAGTVTVGPLATTRMACASDELNQQEAEYLAALQNAATYDITNGMLTIRDADGATQVVAVPAAVEAP
jgi:heat shock protein HslJ